MKNQHLKNILKIREIEKDRLFDLMILDASKAKVNNQFARFEKAHKEALIAYLDAINKPPSRAQTRRKK